MAGRFHAKDEAHQGDVRQKTIRAWEEAQSTGTYPSIDKDPLCHHFENDEGECQCAECPLKDCETPTSAWSKKNYKYILKTLSAWLTVQDIKRLALELYKEGSRKANISIELRYLSSADIESMVAANGGPVRAFSKAAEYVKRLEEWKVG
jgi:hypothetical protein